MTKAVMHLDSQCKVDSCLRCIEFPFKIIGDAIEEIWSVSRWIMAENDGFKGF